MNSPYPPGMYPNKPQPMGHRLQPPSTKWFWWMCLGFLGGGGVSLLLICGGFMLIALGADSSNRRRENAAESMAASAETMASEDSMASPSFSGDRRAMPSFPNPNGWAEDAPTPPEPVDLADCSVELPIRGTQDQNAVYQAVGDPRYRETLNDASAPEGAYIVGMQLTIGSDWGRSISGFRLLFQKGAEYSYGEWHGSAKQISETLVKANDGYVVSGIQIQKGLIINSLRLEFTRLDSDGQLVNSDAYWSDSIGGSGGQSLEFGLSGILLGFSYHTSGDCFDQLGIEVSKPIGEPDVALPRLEVTDIRNLANAGRGAGGVTVRAPENSILVGMRVFIGDKWGNAVGGLQPIYQRENEYLLGQAVGSTRGEMHEVLPGGGLVVGEISFQQGLVLHGIRLDFHELSPDGSLGVERKNSPWFGVDRGRSVSLDPNGLPIAGLVIAAEEDVQKVGILGGTVKVLDEDGL